MDGLLTKPIREEPLRKKSDTTVASCRPPENTSAARSHNELAQTGWNMNELLERLEGDQDLLRELLEMFRDDSQTTLGRAREALAREDLAEMSRAAHTLKGMLKNLSMNATAEIAAAVESAARNGSRGEAEALFKGLERSLAGVMPEVETHLAEVRV